MKNFLVAMLSIGAISYAGYSYYIYSLGPCDRRLEYSIGEFDTRFGISKENFELRVSEAEKVWEDALGREIFVSTEDAKFKINLVYDNRQERTDLKQKAEFGLTAVEAAFEKIDRDFQNLKSEYDKVSAGFKLDSAQFDNQKAEYDREVRYWNARGGAPKEEYEQLEKKRLSLSSKAAELSAEADKINNMAGEVNELLQKRNSAASEYNRVARSYNAKYGHGLEFNQAEYTGREINIYQFTSNSDLRLALAHEFGHALTMDHTENPDSIMYYETQEGGVGDLVLTAEDRAELNRVCTK